MASAKNVGRALGGLLLVQVVIGSTVNFGLLGPAITGPEGFLTNAAQYPERIALAALLLIAGGFISVGIAAAVFPVFDRYSRRAVLAYIALSAAGLALSAVEASTIMSMLTVSQQYVNASGDDARQIELLGNAVRYARHWAHYPHLLVGSGTLLLVYGVLFRFRLVPRLITAIGMATIVLQLIGLSMPFFGYRVNFYLLTPMGICHIVLSLWLVARGFAGDEPEG